MRRPWLILIFSLAALLFAYNLCFATVYYCDDATGDDTDTGLSEALAFKTLQKAFDTVAAGDTCWVKNTNEYAISATIDVDTTDGTYASPITFEGYSSTIGDGGIAVIDGTTPVNSANINFTKDHYYMINFESKNADYSGFRVDGLAIGVMFFNCKAHNNQDGFQFYQGANNTSVFFCESYANSRHGFYSQNYTTYFSCYIHDNSSYGIFLVKNSTVNFCIFDSNTTAGLYINGSISLLGYINLNNTFYNETTGIRASGGNLSQVVLANNTFSDCTTGINCDTGSYTTKNCNFYNNTNDTTGTGTRNSIDDLTSDPGFTDAANGNFTVGTAMKAVGFPNGVWPDGTNQSYIDIGAIQRQEPAAADYPAVADVESGVSFDSGAKTGTFVVPAVGDVESGVTYGAAAQFTGTFGVPTESQVLTAIGFGSGSTQFTGNITLPTAAQVLTTIGFGSNSTEFTGNVVLPSVNDVQEAVTFGASSGLTGVFGVPTAAQTQSGVGFGANDTEFTGTLDAVTVEYPISTTITGTHSLSVTVNIN